MTGTILLLAALLGGVEPAESPAAVPEAAVAAEARPILESLCAHYRRLEHGSVRVVLSIDTGRSGGTSFDFDYDVAFARPNRFAFRPAPGTTGCAMACDGRVLTIVAPMQGTYLRRPAPDAFATVLDQTPEVAALSAAGGAELDVLFGLLGDDPHAAILAAVDSVAYRGRATLAGVEVHRLRMTHHRVHLDLAVRAADPPWLVRAVPDLSSWTDEASPGVRVRIGYRDWSAEAPDDALFDLEPPAAARRVETLYNEPVPAAAPELSRRALVGRPAPDVELDRLDGGTAVRVAEHHGRDVVVLEFWATWCLPCRQLLPRVAALGREFAGRGVAVYAVNLGDGDDDARAMLSRDSIDVPVLMDRRGVAARRYEASAIPLTVVIDRAGTVRHVHIGLVPGIEARLREEISDLLHETAAASDPPARVP